MAISTVTTESDTATSPKSGQGHPYKKMYSKSRRTALPRGADAPDFALRSTPDQWLTLSEFRGQRSCSPFTRPIGVRSAAIRWLFIMKC